MEIIDIYMSRYGQLTLQDRQTELEQLIQKRDENKKTLIRTINSELPDKGKKRNHSHTSIGECRKGEKKLKKIKEAK